MSALKKADSRIPKRHADADGVEAIDDQIRELVQKRARLEIENTLLPLRQQWLELDAKLGEECDKIGLPTAKFLQMSVEQLERYLVERDPTAVGAAAKAGGGRRKVAPKYANPKDKTQTWTGRGAKPIWVREFLAEGGKLENTLIKQEPGSASLKAK